MAGDRREIRPETMARPGGHYSHAVVGGGLVFVALDGSRLNEASFEAQATQTLANVAAALRAAGSDIDRLVQVRVYLTDIDDWPAFNTLYADWAGDARPARAVVPVPMLHHGFRLEIEAVAVA